MSLKVEREEKENPRRLARRFSQRVRRSGIFKKARASQFFKRPLSKTKKKLKALRREEIKKKLRKTDSYQ
jgi:ribosomal protein S21